MELGVLAVTMYSPGHVSNSMGMAETRCPADELVTFTVHNRLRTTCPKCHCINVTTILGKR